VGGIPSTARSIAASVTVTGATSGGLLRVDATDIGPLDSTVLSFVAGRPRANDATIGLGKDAEITVRSEATSPHGSPFGRSRPGLGEPDPLARDLRRPA